MVRATRSTQPTVDSEQLSSSKPSKKRKREDTAENTPKDKDTKEKKRKKPVDKDNIAKDPTPGDAEEEADAEVQFVDAGATPVGTVKAREILEVLQAFDTENLLDRKVSLKGAPTTLRLALSSTDSHTYEHLLSLVSHLRPSETNRRSIPIQKWTNQTRFAQIAKSLLDEAALGSVDGARVSVDVSGKGKGRESRVRYALYQQLPTGGFFTSAAELSSDQLAEISKGQASLVAVQPSISIPPSSLPTLGTYALGPKRPVPTAPKSSKTFNLSSGSFLEYGPYASFAPSFDSEGGQVSRGALDLAVGRHSHRRGKIDNTTTFEDLMDIDEHASDGMDPCEASGSSSAAETAIDPSLELDLPPEMLQPDFVDSVSQGLERLELEWQVDELLQRNGEAMERLLHLQRERQVVHGSDPAGTVKEGSEEWDLAHNVWSSLTALTSLRPRPNTAEDTSIPYLPSHSSLRALQKLLPISPAPGWKGTLTPAKDYALIDNITVRAGTPIPAPTPSTPVANARPQATHSYSTPYASRPAAAALSQHNPTSYYPPHTHAYTGYNPYATKPLPAPAANTITATGYPYTYGYGYANYTYQTPLGVGVGPQQQRAIANLSKAPVPGTPTPPGVALNTALMQAGKPAPTLPPHLRRPAVGGTPVGSTPVTPTKTVVNGATGAK